MRVQSIQTSNNNNKTNFKARFINDKNGNFQKIWNDANKSRDLYIKAKNFSDVHPYDTLEIVGIDKIGVSTKGCDVFNHNTGVTSSYKFKTIPPQNMLLEILLDSIDEDRNLFNNDFTTKIYDFLLGKN